MPSDIDFQELLMQSQSLSAKTADGLLRKRVIPSHDYNNAETKVEKKRVKCNLEGFMNERSENILLNTMDVAKKTVTLDVRCISNRLASNEWSNAKAKILADLGHVYCVPQSTLPSGQNAWLSKNHEDVNSTFSFSGRLMSPEFRSFFLKHTSIVHGVLEGAKVTGNSSTQLRLAQQFGDLEEAQGATTFLEVDSVQYKNLMYFASHVVRESLNAPAGYFGAVAASCVFSNENSKYLLESKRLQLASGARIYFEEIYMSYLQLQVSNAIRSGQVSKIPPTSQGHTSRRTLMLYLDIMRKSVGFVGDINIAKCVAMAGEEKPIITSIPVWGFVYYCLRVGEFSTAIFELQQHANDPVTKVVLDVLVPLQQLMLYHEKSINFDIRGWDYALCGELIRKVCMCGDIYAELSGEMDSFTDPYLLQVLRIFSLSDVIIAGSNEATGLVNFTDTIEDYLWVNTWHIWLSRFLESCAIAVEQGGGDARQFASIRLYKEQDLWNTVESYGGREHFDPHFHQPVTYANVLICCQKYNDAVLHLWLAGRKFIAIHLLLTLMHYGLILPSVPLSLESDSGKKLTGILLCQEWFKPFLLSNPTSVVDYLLLVQGGYFMHYLDGYTGAEKQQLCGSFEQQMTEWWMDYIVELVRADQATQNHALMQGLIGYSADSGTRDCARTHTGYLDRYAFVFPRKDFIDQILYKSGALLLALCKQQASIVARTDKTVDFISDFNDSLWLFLLVGRYVDVVEELCGQLSALLSHVVGLTEGNSNTVVDIAQLQLSSARKIITTTQDFYEKYVKDGYGEVVKNLQARGREDLIQTLEILLTFSLAFDKFSQGRFGEVLILCDKVCLLPVHAGDVAQKIGEFSRIPAVVNACLSEVLIIVIESVRALFERSTFKRGLSADNVHSQLSLQQRAHGLYAYATELTSGVRTSNLRLRDGQRGDGAAWQLKPQVLVHIHRIYNSMI